ncbi:uncharacterized protein LOC128229264 [Mya arenaria]|uniref:uncharacterized protein LOC128229264 n=1 Tax=Mya arenaria TaxID=6604 RepID=UPI0022E83D5D|nr:uncharacterized protein LOC128229264 [Mya arenaria]XP_052797038.1 uncharacterized protein LOC128229264 [Mya arenaria]XP_052797039.1 uncharacterized protein LOC128229264 [Mya arenaria]
MEDNTTFSTPNSSFPGGSGKILNSYEIHRIAAPELLVIDRVITPIFYLIGIIGNPLSAVIWLSKKVRKSNSSAIYLGTIAIVDTFFLFVHVWLELLQAWGVKTFNRPDYCEVYMIISMTPQYLAPLLILGFTFERFIAICFPFLKNKVCTVKKAVIVVNTLSIFALGLGIAQVFIWTYDDTVDICNIRPETHVFYSVWTWVSEMVIFVAVPVTVLVFNILVIREIKKMSQMTTSFGNDAGRASNQTSTVTLLSVSFYLIFTLLPATIVYAIQTTISLGNMTTPPEEWTNDDSWSTYLTYYHVRRIIEEICLSNYACYVFIYYATSDVFRQKVHEWWCWKRFIYKSENDKQSSFTTEYKIVSHKTRSQTAMDSVNV